MPVRPSRQFRRVNSAFVKSLTQELQKEPGGSHGCLFVVAKDIATKEEFNINKKDACNYEVLGGTHLMLATKHLHSQEPENEYFSGRMAQMCCGHTDDQAIYLGAMYQNTTYREEVCFVSLCKYWVGTQSGNLVSWSVGFQTWTKNIQGQ